MLKSYCPWVAVCKCLLVEKNWAVQTRHKQIERVFVFTRTVANHEFGPTGGKFSGSNDEVLHLGNMFGMANKYASFMTYMGWNWWCDRNLGYNMNAWWCWPCQLFPLMNLQWGWSSYHTPAVNLTSLTEQKLCWVRSVTNESPIRWVKFREESYAMVLVWWLFIWIYILAVEDVVFVGPDWVFGLAWCS